MPGFPIHHQLPELKLRSIELVMLIQYFPNILDHKILCLMASTVVQIIVSGITVLEYWPAKVTWLVMRPSPARRPALSSHAYPSASRHLESVAIAPPLRTSDIVTILSVKF